MFAVLYLLSTLMLSVNAECVTNAAEELSGAGREISQLYAGYYHKCVVYDDGYPRCWGRVLGSRSGEQVGDAPNEMGANLQPVPFSTTVKYIAKGGDGPFICAHMSDDTVECLGANYRGQLGTGDTTWRTTPVKIDLGTNMLAKYVACGADHVCVWLQNNDVKCWGWNQYGLLGYGDQVNRGDNANEMGDNLPVIDFGNDPNTDNAWVTAQFYVGYVHNCAVSSSGCLRCWGHPQYGGLGYGHSNCVGCSASAEVKDSPCVDIGSLELDYLSLGDRSTFLVAKNGRVYPWGGNWMGQLGLGHTNAIGDQASEMGDNLVAIDFGDRNDYLVHLGIQYRNGCAMFDKDGVRTISCWGSNSNGNLGTGFESRTNTKWQGHQKDYIGNEPGEMGNELFAVRFNRCNCPTGDFIAGTHSGSDIQCRVPNEVDVPSFYTAVQEATTWKYTYTMSSHCSNTMVPGIGPMPVKMNQGYLGTLVELDNGDIVNWGYNWQAQCGVGNTQNQPIPTDALDFTGGTPASTCVKTPAPVVEVDGYTHTAEGCVIGKNIQKLRNKSAAECAELCTAYGTACVGFELYRNYGGSKGAYQPGDCNLQSSTDMSGCDGTKYNLDFYTRTNFAGSPDLISALEALAVWSDSVELSTQVSCADFDWLSGCTEDPSVCPTTHPYAYRPSHGYDHCCATDKDSSGDVRGSGGNVESCQNNDHVKCSAGSGCVDYNGVTYATPTNDDMVKFTAMVASNYYTLDGFQPILTVNDE